MPGSAFGRRRLILAAAASLALVAGAGEARAQVAPDPDATPQLPQGPLQPPEPAPGGWVAPFIDLSGQWRDAGNGLVLDFALVPGGADFVATGPGTIATMATLPGGRVRLRIVIDAQPAATQGDLVVEGPPGGERYTIVFDPLRDTSRVLTFERVD